MSLQCYYGLLWDSLLEKHFAIDPRHVDSRNMVFCLEGNIENEIVRRECRSANIIQIPVRSSRLEPQTLQASDLQFGMNLQFDLQFEMNLQFDPHYGMNHQFGLRIEMSLK